MSAMCSMSRCLNFVPTYDKLFGVTHTVSDRAVYLLVLNDSLYKVSQKVSQNFENSDVMLGQIIFSNIVRNQNTFD